MPDGKVVTSSFSTTSFVTSPLGYDAVLFATATDAVAKAIIPHNIFITVLLYFLVSVDTCSCNRIPRCLKPNSEFYVSDELAGPIHTAEKAAEMRGHHHQKDGHGFQRKAIRRQRFLGIAPRAQVD